MEMEWRSKRNFGASSNTAAIHPDGDYANGNIRAYADRGSVIDADIDTAYYRGYKCPDRYRIYFGSV